MWDWGRLKVFIEDVKAVAQRGEHYRVGPWTGRCLLNVGKVHIMWVRKGLV